MDAAVMPARTRAAGGRNPFGAAGPTFTIAIPGQSFGVQVECFNQSPSR